MIVSKVYFTAAEVSADPSANLTPLFSVKV